MILAKFIVAFVAVYGFGGVVADAVVPFTARQHLRNPAWPPHAKFHNAQTMLLGAICGAIALAVLFGSRPLTLPPFLVAAAVASAYWVAMALAPLFPGTGWYDPEFRDASRRPLGYSPQQLLTYALCALSAAAVGLAVLA